MSLHKHKKKIKKSNNHRKLKYLYSTHLKKSFHKTKPSKNNENKKSRIQKKTKKSVLISRRSSIVQN